MFLQKHEDHRMLVYEYFGKNVKERANAGGDNSKISLHLEARY
jgi:hypothetical protein